MFRALQLHCTENGSVQTLLRDDLDDSDLDEGDVTVDVEWSGINYKDGLAFAGDRGVMRIDPLIPGIDLVGTVGRSEHPDFRPGERVLLNGWGIGETRNGGLSERARVRGEWLVALPDAFSARQAAAIGTAGFTAALSVLALERAGLGDGEVLVTGSSGGVGSIAIALLAAAGRRVIAATGRPEQRGYLLGLGAVDTIARSELEQAGKPLQYQRWAGVVDSAGGRILASALAQTRYGGTVAACGLVGGSDIPTTVMPFILRGVGLLGINSVECPMPLRLEAWRRLARDLDTGLLDSLTASVALAEAPDVAARIVAGGLRGRTVVDVRG